MRAVEPRVEGFTEDGGIKIGYEVFGDGPRTVLFMPIDSIVQSRAWKAQVPYLARRYRVITIDPPGNGRSDRPRDPAAYGDLAMPRDTLAVMDAENVEQAVLIGICQSAWWGLLLAADHPERVRAVVTVGAFAPYLTPQWPEKQGIDFDIRRDSYHEWEKVNRHYWREHFQEYAEWFFSKMLPEPHSTKQWDDVVGWALDAGPECLIADQESAMAANSREQSEAILRRVRCPVLAIHGGQDACQPATRSRAIAELTGGEYVELEGVGHLPQARHPVVVNRLITRFLERVAPVPPSPQSWQTAHRRARRVLYLSSPIGLGHARRDIAIVDELRQLRPDIEVEWLAQHPLTTLLEQRGERIHPASRHLATESAHFEAESAEHDLHAFQAIRRMDEVLVNNFMVFSDLVESEHFDLWVGDEAWDLDYFLHENPELKRAAFAWLTDFVGWLPMPDGGEREAALSADYNAEMVEQRARYPRLRDVSLFVGNPDDIIPEQLGPGLPAIRDWTERNFDFVGYVTGFDPSELGDRDDLRAGLGFRPEEKICMVTVGGSGVGAPLLRRVMAAYPEARRAVPGLRLIVVAGPRIDAGELKAPEGVEVHGYVPDLYRQLAACDLAVVQGGLTTTMELTANRRPFIYLPLRHHFEQNFHVRHRLSRYGAGRCLDYDDATPEVLAAAMAEELTRPVDYRPVETDGARRAAERLAELV